MPENFQSPKTFLSQYRISSFFLFVQTNSRLCVCTVLYYTITIRYYARLCYTDIILLFTRCWGDNECLMFKLAERGILLPQ